MVYEDYTMIGPSATAHNAPCYLSIFQKLDVPAVYAHNRGLTPSCSFVNCNNCANQWVSTLKTCHTLHPYPQTDLQESTLSLPSTISANPHPMVLTESSINVAVVGTGYPS